MADRPGPGGSLPAMLRPALPRRGLASTVFSYSSYARANSNTQLPVFLALAVTLAAFLVLAGVTLTVGIVALVVISPLLLITSPLWAPLALVAIAAGGAMLFGCGLAVFALSVGTWAHRHLAGRHPVGAHRVGYSSDARGRVRFAGAARHGTNHYGHGYGRRKDAAPKA
ncbi:unnamed protein product [Alopecurus aequalis]